jgi:hypothetical protein
MAINSSAWANLNAAIRMSHRLRGWGLDKACDEESVMIWGKACFGTLCYF